MTYFRSLTLQNVEKKSRETAKGKENTLKYFINCVFTKMYSPKSTVDKLKQGQSPLRRRSLNLPLPLRVEVRSPGFSTRLSTLIRENEASQAAKCTKKALQPPLAAAAFNPKYQGFGSMPRVKLERRSLPRLAVRNSR